MKIVALLACFFIQQTLWAQSKPVASSPAPVKISFKTSLAGRGNGNLIKELVRILIDSPLVVKDEKGKVYPVVRYTFNYSFSSVYVDGETKQRKVRQDFRSKTFETTTLPEVWRSSIKENIRNGDVIFYNDVIICMPDGKKRMVEDLRIVIGD